VIVRLGRLQPPFVDCPSMPFRCDPRFRPGDVLGKEQVLFGLAAVQRQRAPISCGRGKPGMGERLPVVRVVRDVPELTGTTNVRNVPVVTVTFARPAGVTGHRLVAGLEAHALGEQHRRACLDGHGVRHSRQVAGVDEQTLDVQGRAVGPFPRPRQQFAGEFLQAGLDGALPAGTAENRGQGPLGVAEREVQPLLVREHPVVDDVAGEVLLPGADAPVQQLVVHVDEGRSVRSFVAPLLAAGVSAARVVFLLAGRYIPTFGQLPQLPSATAMDDETRKFLKQVTDGQGEQADAEYQRIHRVQAATFALLRELTRHWGFAIDMAQERGERMTAATVLVWCGAAEARFELIVLSDTEPVRAQATVTGRWQPQSLLDAAKRHLGSLLRGTVRVQAETDWALRLTSEGERLQRDLCKHPENDCFVWNRVMGQWIPPRVHIRLLELPRQPSPAPIASANAQIDVRMGDIVIENKLGSGPDVTQRPCEPGRTRAMSDSNSGTEGGGNAVAADPKWQSIAEVEEQIRRLAPTNWSILFLGGTGTGKEFYANKIHQASLRKRKPLVTINCATLPKERIDSELFGHVRGAFTGAARDYSGKIRQAEGGTVFLDEIGELPKECWGNLLRFLQDKEIHPVGGNTLVVDVRLLAATNKSDRVPKDALHRFDHVLCLPPLRYRREDIPALAKSLFESAKRNVHGRSALRFPQRELDLLCRAEYLWPGNIRQLQKAILRAVALHDSGRNLTAQEVLDAAETVVT